MRDRLTATTFAPLTAAVGKPLISNEGRAWCRRQALTLCRPLIGWATIFRTSAFNTLPWASLAVRLTGDIQTHRLAIRHRSRGAARSSELGRGRIRFHGKLGALAEAFQCASPW
jgi:hypothetical protein